MVCGRRTNLGVLCRHVIDIGSFCCRDTAMVKVGGKTMKEQGNGFGGDLAGKREIQVLKMFSS